MGDFNAIAGIVNEGGNVLGLMPHPENHVEAALSNRWARAVCGLVDYVQTGGVRPRPPLI